MAEATTVIAAGTSVRGHLQGAEDLLVQGSLQGSIRLEASLTIDPEGRVDATVEVVSAVVHGVVVGRIAASDFVELAAGARMKGDVVAPRVILRDGAQFAGLIDMGDVPAEQATGAKAAPSPARPVAGGVAPRPSVAAPPPAARPVPTAPPSARPFPSAAPPPVPTSRPAPVPAPAPVAVVPEPAPAEPEAAFEEEPELPDAAARKTIAVKKRK